MIFMKTQTIKTAGALLSAAALISGGAVSVAAAAPAAPAQQDTQATVELVDVASATVEERAVEGTFGYSQDVVSSTEQISCIFCKAAATLCAGLPQYSAQLVGSHVVVSGDNGVSFEASVADMAADEDATSYVMACACATNAAGGGAVANADVSGVSLASILGYLAS